MRVQRVLMPGTEDTACAFGRVARGAGDRVVDVTLGYRRR